MLYAAFADDTLAASPSYSDLSAYTLGFRVYRGRQSEFERNETGEGTVRLQNRTGAFDATNVGGPFAGNLLPLTQSQLKLANPITGGSPLSIFTGYLESFAYTRTGATESIATATLVDALELFGNADVKVSTDPRVYGAFYAAAHVDDRIKAALFDMGWASAKTRIATGNVNVLGRMYESGSKYLQVILDAADAEFPGISNFFADKDGNAAFSGRGIRFAPISYGFNPVVPNGDWTHWDVTNNRPGWRLGDEAACAADPTLLPIAKDGIEWTFGKELLYNDALVAPEGASAAGLQANHVSDAASKARYGPRSLPPILGLIILNGATSGKSALDEAKDMAQYFVNNYKVPRDRITRIEIHGEMDDGNTSPGGAPGNLWDFIRKVELNHVVEITTTNPGGGGISAEQFFVEGISHDVSSLNSRVPKWTMNLDLSAKARYASYP